MIPAPEFPPAEWINTPTPLTLAGLRNRVVVLDFWDCTSLDCQRGLAYRRAWQERYADGGLTMIAIHSPRFRFARDRAVVAGIAASLGIHWPVALDNDGAFAAALDVRGVPTLVLIDTAGRVRFRSAGQRGYAQAERSLQSLLAESRPQRSFPNPVPPVRPEDAPGAVCPPTTPELDAAALGNPGILPPLPTQLEAPVVHVDGRLYLDGLWRACPDGLTLAGETGAIFLSYHAASVYAVLSPTPDRVAWSPELHRPLEVLVTQDDSPLPHACFAEDVFLSQGQACVRVDQPRLYALVRHPDVRSHRLRLAVRGPGLTVYAFSFGTCADPTRSIESRLSQSHAHPMPME